MVDKRILALLVVLAVIAVGMIAANHFGSHRLDVKSCFDDVRGLKAGAAVRLAGVDIGTVRSVRAQPQNKSCPAEVEMILTTSYRLPVPRDALAGVETAGVLGETLVSIDVGAASGPPIDDYGYLRSKPRVPEPSLGDVVKAVGAAAAVVKAANNAATNNTGQPVRKPSQ
ncbi:MAG: MCE family protein [Terriglobales bacterium]